MASWWRLGASWVVLGSSCGALGRLGRNLDALLGVLEAFGTSLGRLVGAFRRLVDFGVFGVRRFQMC